VGVVFFLSQFLTKCRQVGMKKGGNDESGNDANANWQVGMMQGGLY
jgi:hypothetical protein